MKIFVLLLFSFLPFFSISLLAKPMHNTYSVPEDSVFVAEHVQARDGDNSLSLPDDTMACKAGAIAPTANVVGDICGQGIGSIDITPDPNTPGPWSYHWSTLATTQDINSLSAGTYTVTVTDANGNIQIEQWVILDFLVTPTGTNAVITGNSQCLTPFDGALDLTVLPLAVPWTYEWSTGATTQDITGLNSETYTVTISYGVTCTSTYDYEVPDLSNHPNVFLAGLSSSCERADGVAGIIAMNGGVAPYTFLWSNGGTNFFIIDLFAGTYTVTVTGANGCTTTAERTVENINWPLFVEGVEIDSNTTCIGGNGSIDILIVHPIAQGPFLYTWSNGATTEDISNVPAGFYSVTISFNPACTIVEYYEVEHEPLIPAIAFYNTNTTCGMSNGIVNLNVNPGGTPPYAYLWSTGATTQDLNNVPAGTYEVIITGTNGCTFTGEATIDDVPILFGYSALVTDQSSCDTTNGQINLSLYPSNLAFQWSNGATTKILKNLAPGDYTVTISAGGTCTEVATYSVGDVPEYPSIPAVIDTTTCGLTNGAIDLSVLGYAVTPLTYQWSNGATTQDLTGIKADTFYVTVTSAVGCSTTNTFIVPNFNDTIRVQGNLADNISCASPTGSIALNVTPLDTAYTYLWSNGMTTDSLSSLTAGDYFVTVTLGLTCISLDSFVIANTALPPNLSAFGNGTHCDFSNGTVNLSISGGTGPFNFLWSNAATTEDISNLSPGDYSVTVTGANACTAVSMATVLNNNIPLSVNGAAAGNTSCVLANGSVDVSVSPAGAYHYLWSNAATSEDLNDLAPGFYTVTVSLGTCISSGTFSVADNALPPSLSASGLAANCGLGNGAADLNLSGGIGPFNFIWSNTASTEDLANLLPGTYTVTVTGANACTAVSMATVLNNNITLNLSAAPVSNSSCTAANGSIDISVTPAGTYNYLWSNAATSEDLNNLNSGTITVTVTLGTCQSSSTFSVADNTATPVLASNITASICGVNNGGIDLSVSGTAGPFAYLWSNAATTEDLSSILPGNYSVTVTALNGCTELATFNVANNASNFSLAATSTSLTNCAFNNGAIDLNVTPTGAFLYLWSNGATTQDLSGLLPGTYTVSVTELGSCTATASYFVIDQRTSPLSSQAVVPELCGQADGSIDLSVSSGTAPFAYLWASGQINQDLANLAAGTYTVTVTDANDCTVSASATVPGNSISFSLAGTSISNISCIQNNGAIDLTVNPPGGVSFLWSNASMNEDLIGLDAGIYTVTVSAGGNCTNTAAFTITNDLPSPSLSQNILAAFCGQASGGIDLNVSGSLAPYQYKWSNAAVVEDLNGVVSGSYTVTVTAANGCTTIQDFTVPENTIVPNIASALTQSTSCVVSNGAIELSITPSSATGYSFLWSNQATTEDLANLSAGTYTVTVNGGGACTNTASMTVGSTIPLPSIADNVGAATCGQASGSIDLTITGSVGPYLFAWSNSAITEDLSNTLSGTFTVTVTAANGCSSVGNFTVPENVVLPLINGTPTADNSCILNNGSVKLSVGPATNYTFTWSNAAITEDLANLAAGSYTVTVNGGGACTATANFVIADQTTQPQAAITAATMALDCSTTSTTLNGSATDTPNPTVFQWSLNGNPVGSGSSTLPVNTPGVYNLLVTDNVTSCTASASITVTQSLDLPQIIIANPSQLTCAVPSQTLTGSSTVLGVEFAWATIIGTDTTFLGNGASLLVSTPETYYLLGVNPANNCPNAVSVNVTADQTSPTANAGAPFTLDCAGETAPLNGSGAGATNLVYQWSTQDGHFVSGAGSASPLVDKAGTYSLLVTNPSNGCTDIDEVIILPEIPVVYASVIQPSCLDEQGTVLADSVTGLSNPILYSLNNSQPGTQNQFENLAPGTYTLQAQGLNGCSASVVVTLNAPALVEITLEPEATISLGYSYLLDPGLNINSADIASVVWSPSTGLLCDTCLSTTARPFSSTQYQVVVVSNAGCEARGNINLTVDKTRKVYGPNIFSPDEDGKNDVFTIFADPFTVVKIKSLRVYSRWGEEVFELLDFAPGDIARGWDGTFKGQKLNPSVFVWQAVVDFVDGKEELFTGDVTIQR